MLSGDATNTNFIFFGLIRPGLEPTIYHTPGKHNNRYTTDAVNSIRTASSVAYITTNERWKHILKEQDEH